MTTEEERSSDPFPFLKIHRTVEALAIAMSTSFRISIAEAGWGLMQFWRRCADPREIERMYDTGKRHVFLDEETLKRRLVAAFGADLDHAQLSEIGVLERRDDGTYRVRGTSDFFKIIDEARRAAQAGSKGGKKAAAKKKAASGQGVLEPPLEKEAEMARGAQQETRDERLERREKTPPRTPSAAEDMWDCMEQARVDRCADVGIDAGEDVRPPPAEINAKLKRAVAGDEPRLVGEVVIQPLDDLAVLHTRFLADDFGRVDKHGKPRVPPWPTGLFLSPGVLSRLREAEAREAA